MRVSSILMSLFIISIAVGFTNLEAEDKKPVPEKRMLENAVTEYQALKKNLDTSLKNQTGCELGVAAQEVISWCSIKPYCANAEVKKDSPILYQNAAGESVTNDSYFDVRNMVVSCLKSKFEDEIKDKKDELMTKLKTEHLKKIMAANQKLITLTAKYGQGSNLSRITSEILTMSLEENLGDLKDEKDSAKNKNDLINILKKAEKRSKTSLKPEIENTLVEIEFLKKNPQYLEDVKKMEAALVPEETAKKDFFNDFEQLKTAEAAGSEEKLKANREKLTQKTQEAYDLFLQTKKDILNYLEKQKNENNAVGIERAKTRVSTIRFMPPRLTKSLIEDCESPNAYQNKSTHSFVICPQYLNYPKMSLRETMIHEIAHSIDSCNLSGKFYKVKKPEEVEDAPFEIDIKMSEKTERYTNSFLDDPLPLKPENRVQDKMPYADHPFSKTISCLKDSLSVGAINVDVDIIKKKTKESLNELDHLGENNPNNPEARLVNFANDNMDEFFKYAEGCNRKSGGALTWSQMQESFADKISSEIIAEDFKRMTPEEAKKSMLEITMGYSEVCNNQSASEIKIRQFGVKEGCKDYLENTTKEDNILNALNISINPKFDPHPKAANRIERIHMAHPEIRKALNCKEETGVKYCE